MDADAGRRRNSRYKRAARNIEIIKIEGADDQTPSRRQAPNLKETWPNSISGSAGPCSPAGWVVEHDVDGTEYYWNEALRSASWTRPVLSHGGSPMDGWAEYDDESSGMSYYYNVRERSASWTHPSTGLSHSAKTPSSQPSALLSSRI